MKAFFALACLAVASADPATIYTNRFGQQTIVPDVYDYAAVNPILATSSLYNAAILPKTMTTTYVQPAQTVAKTYIQDKAQKEAQEEQINKMQLQKIIEQQAALNRGNQAAQAQAYSAQQQMELQKAAVPKPSQMKIDYIPGKIFQNQHLIFKREAESDPTTFLQYNSAFGVPSVPAVRTTVGVPYSNIGTTVGYPFNNLATASMYNRLYNPLATSLTTAGVRVLGKREAESDPALTYINGMPVQTLGSTYYPNMYNNFGLRSPLHPYGLTTNTGLRFLGKREAESDPALTYINGMPVQTLGSTYYPNMYNNFGVRSPLHPYGLTTTTGLRFLGKREAESDPALVYRTNPYITSTLGFNSFYSGLRYPGYYL